MIIFWEKFLNKTRKKDLLIEEQLEIPLQEIPIKPENEETSSRVIIIDLNEE